MPTIRPTRQNMTHDTWTRWSAAPPRTTFRAVDVTYVSRNTCVLRLTKQRNLVSYLPATFGIKAGAIKHHPEGLQVRFIRGGGRERHEAYAILPFPLPSEQGENLWKCSTIAAIAVPCGTKDKGQTEEQRATKPQSSLS